MVKLSMKAGMLSILVILGALMLGGCDSGILAVTEANTMMLNGWTITSTEGVKALENLTALTATATKKQP